MVFFILILALLSLGLKILSSQTNEGAFSVKALKEGFCWVGRIYRDDRGYDALIGYCGQTCKSFALSGPKDDYSYTVDRLGSECLAGVVFESYSKTDIGLVLYTKDVRFRLNTLGGVLEEMLWFLKVVSKDKVLLVGGVREKDWDLWVALLDRSFKPIWSVRLPLRGHQYAYGAVETQEGFVVVGRMEGMDGWDPFVAVFSHKGRLKAFYRVPFKGKNYFRFAYPHEGDILLVGRTEVNEDSDLLLCRLKGRDCFVYDVGSYDYGRSISEQEGTLIVVGDTEVESRDGLILILDKTFEIKKAYRVGLDDVESIRFVDKNLIAGYTYSFSFDNDAMVGEIDLRCPLFESARAKVKRTNFPLKPLEVSSDTYPLKEVSFPLKMEELPLKAREPCKRR